VVVVVEEKSCRASPSLRRRRRKERGAARVFLGYLAPLPLPSLYRGGNLEGEE